VGRTRLFVLNHLSENSQGQSSGVSTHEKTP
jgi:hypothetical protein